MANFPKMQLTSKGLELLTNVQAGADNLIFTKTALGDGVLSVPVSTLTNLVSIKAEIPISEGKTIGNNTYQIGAFFNNTEITTGFWWREIGVFAKGNNGTEILYCYSNAGDAGDYIPVGSDERIEKYIYQSLAIGNATNVTAQINSSDSFILSAEKGKPSGVAPLGADGKIPLEFINIDTSTFEETVKKVNTDLTNHLTATNPHNISKTTVGLANVPNVSTNDQTPTYTEATSLTNLTSGEKLGIAFGKIKKAITDLMSHIANKTNPHGTTAAQVGALSNKGGSIQSSEFPRIDLHTDNGFSRIMKNSSKDANGEVYDYGLLLGDYNGKNEAESINLMLSYKSILENNLSLNYALKLAAVMGGTAKYYNIFGEHNKPTVTYTGNASYSRTVNIGGVGNVLCVRSVGTTTTNQRFANTYFVTPDGVTVFGYTDSTSTITPKSYSDATFKNGILTIGSCSVLNADLMTYYCYVL